MDKVQKILTEQGGIDTFLPDNAQWKNRFEIESESSNRVYIVAQNKSTGIFGCSCMGWIRYRKCKHLTAIAPLLKAAEEAENAKSNQKRLG